MRAQFGQRAVAAAMAWRTDRRPDRAAARGPGHQGLREKLERCRALGMLRVQARVLETERLTVERDRLLRAALEPSQAPERVEALGNQRVLAMAGALANGEGFLEVWFGLGEVAFEDQELAGTAAAQSHGQVGLAYRLLPRCRAALDGPPGHAVETAQHRGVGADVERLGVVDLVLAVDAVVDGQRH